MNSSGFAAALKTSPLLPPVWTHMHSDAQLDPRHITAAICSISRLVWGMYKTTMSGRLQPMHKAMMERPRHEHFHKDRRSKHKKGPRRASEPSQPSRPSTPPAWRKQILRIASESFDEVNDDPQPPQTPQPAPSTPPYPPPPPEEDEHATTTADSSEQRTNSQDLVDMINNLHYALVDSHNKLESLFQKTTTVLVTQHDTMTALISSCK